VEGLSSAAAAPKLSVAGLTKYYDDLEVLSDIAVDVGDGEFVSIVGPSGCGKTTFLRIVDGLEAYDAGTVAIDGRRVTKPGSDRAFVFQADSLQPWRSVWSNAAIGLEIQGRLTPVERDHLSRLLELVGLKGFEKYYPRQLSGGMRQRVNLARALAVHPEVLLMDEPFAALDEINRFKLNNDLLALWQALRRTVIFVTHSVFESVYLSQRIVVMTPRPGRVFADIAIPAPYPRDERFRTSADFAGYCRTVSEALGKAMGGAS
jgi:NitT/TauT family transport system ATP-binding protein